MSRRNVTNVGTVTNKQKDIYLLIFGNIIKQSWTELCFLETLQPSDKSFLFRWIKSCAPGQKLQVNLLSTSVWRDCKEEVHQEVNSSPRGSNNLSTAASSFLDLGFELFWLTPTFDPCFWFVLCKYFSSFVFSSSSWQAERLTGLLKKITKYLLRFAFQRRRWCFGLGFGRKRCYVVPKAGGRISLNRGHAPRRVAIGPREGLRGRAPNACCRRNGGFSLLLDSLQAFLLQLLHHSKSELVNCKCEADGTGAADSETLPWQAGAAPPPESPPSSSL